jgi:alpha-galactosidase
MLPIARRRAWQVSLSIDDLFSSVFEPLFPLSGSAHNNEIANHQISHLSRKPSMKPFSSVRFRAAFVLLAIFPACGFAEPVGHWADNTLVLDNGVVSRKIAYDAKRQSFTSTELKVAGSMSNWLGRANDEFSFEIDGTACNGTSGWEVKSVEPLKDSLGGEGVTATLRSAAANPAKIEVKLDYLLYPKLPVIRKRLILKNISAKDIKVESVDVERLRPNLHIGSSKTFFNFARESKVGPYEGDYYDTTVVVHNEVRRAGVVLGNEAPGVLKRTATYQDDGSMAVGLTHRGHVYAFRKWLRPGESWESDWTFLCPYSDCASVECVLSGPVADYLRRHLGLRVGELKTKPVLAYNTWYPFHENISEPMLLKLAEAAAESGVTDFQIDAGWHTNEFSPANDPYWSAIGDYRTDPRKLPRGLKPVFDRVRELGMRPGLWMSLASVGKNSRVFREHPEWLVRTQDGKPNYIAGNPEKYKTVCTACLTTDWYDHIKAAMLKQIKEHDLRYIKIDIGFVTGVYRGDEANSGCFATNHPHRDREESLWMNYQRAWQLFDELHAAAPELYIDCTFETLGRYQLIDLGMCRHAHGNWIFNCYDNPPLGSLRQRNLAWLASPVIPAPSLMIGCMRMDHPQTDFIVGSLAGTLPIFLGDPRNLSAAQRERFREWSHWFAAMQQKHDYFLFRQDLAEFGEPREGGWDGWQRINTETGSGGIVGVFRHGSRDSQRRAYVERLDPAKIYAVRRAPQGTEITRLTGKELQEKGFAVDLENAYDSALFEIDRE